MLREGMTTHGNRAGCIQQARDESIPKSVVLKHCGLKSSYDTNESSYDSVDYASDSQVRAAGDGCYARSLNFCIFLDWSPCGRVG